MWQFGRNLPSATFSSERVKPLYNLRPLSSVPKVAVVERLSCPRCEYFSAPHITPDVSLRFSISRPSILVSQAVDVISLDYLVQ